MHGEKVIGVEVLQLGEGAIAYAAQRHETRDSVMIEQTN